MTVSRTWRGNNSQYISLDSHTHPLMLPLNWELENILAKDVAFWTRRQMFMSRLYLCIPTANHPWSTYWHILEVRQHNRQRKSMAVRETQCTAEAWSATGNTYPSTYVAIELGAIKHIDKWCNALPKQPQIFMSRLFLDIPTSTVSNIVDWLTDTSWKWGRIVGSENKRR